MAFDTSGGNKSKSNSPAPSSSSRGSNSSASQSPVSSKTRLQYSAKDPTRPNHAPPSPTKTNSKNNLLSNTTIRRTSNNQQTVITTETYESKSRIVETREKEVIQNGQYGQPSKPATNNNSRKSSINSSNGNHTDMPDRAATASKQNFIEVFQENPLPEKRSSINENNNINVMKNGNNSKVLNTSEPRIYEPVTKDTRQHLDNSTVAPRNQLDSLNSCSDDLPSFSSSIDDLELRDLRRAKREVDLRLVDREDQVEELSNQVEMLLSVKNRLENEVSQVKKELKREIADKEDELEDTRASAAKRIKNLEQQLETEHEERLSFVRERHDLEGKIMTLKDAIDHGNSEEEDCDCHGCGVCPEEAGQDPVRLWRIVVLAFVIEQIGACLLLLAV